MNIYFVLVLTLVRGTIGEVKESQSTTVKPLTTTETEIPDSDCVTNQCSKSSLQQCLNDGECITDPSTCKTKCACAKGFHGKMCQYRYEYITTKNISDDTENKDFSNFKPRPSSDCSGQVCVNGECVPAPFGTSRCQCKEGWFGANCGTSGSVIDDDFLKAILNKSPKKLAETEDRKVKDENRHSKNISDDDVTEVVTNKPERNRPRKESRIRLNIQNKEKPAKIKLVDLESLETKDNVTIMEDILIAKYNVCKEDPAERSDDERRCENAKDMKCVYGVCNETLTDYGSWKGYTTECNCDIGARGLHCEHKCCLDCGENGKCDVRIDGDNVTEHCNCRQRFTGFFCEIYVPDPVSIQIKEDTWYMWVVGVCVGTFAILVSLAVVGPYFMWKHRVILVMKIVHYFQAYEDDDEKEWDAFVSYKSHPTDENFVVRVLYPKLEKKLGFKLCLHFRDFVPGETISNNIINAVEGSRRTILILTPRYVESEFTRFEYQKAQTEMLKRKHRIIPIMLEDISEVSDIDKNLKGIIGSVTYLEWPGNDESTNSSKKLEKFWKRLQLSLPKKKVSDYEKNISSSNPPDVSSFTPPSKEVIVPSDKDSGFKSSMDSFISRDSTASEAISDWWCSDSTYTKIGDVCEDLGELVKPLSEEEELELIARGSKQNDDGVKLVYDYVEMEHDRYIEFKPEDNPASAHLSRNKLESYIDSKMEDDQLSGSIVKKELPENYIEFELEDSSSLANVVKKELPENYIEFELEDNQPPTSVVKKDLPENYIEFELEDSPLSTNVVKKDLPENYIEFEVKNNKPQASIVKKELPENYIEFRLEENSPLASPSNEELPENYIEFKAEDNPPSASLTRKRPPVIQLYTDDYIEIDV